MESNAVYTTGDAGLSRFFRKRFVALLVWGGTFGGHFLSVYFSFLSHVLSYSHELFLRNLCDLELPLLQHGEHSACN